MFFSEYSLFPNNERLFYMGHTVNYASLTLCHPNRNAEVERPEGDQ